MLKKYLVACVLVTAFLLPACAGLPQADFKASVTSGQVPLKVSFTNITETYPLEYADKFQWDFGDGASITTSTAEEPVTHEYTKPGSYTVTLTAIKKGEPPQTSTMTLDITVNPGALDVITTSPMIEVAAGETEQLEVTATDEYGNDVSDVEIIWTVNDENAGSVNETGLLTAGKIVGSFSDAVELHVTQGEVVRTAVASVTIMHGPLEQVVIAPNTIDIGMEMTQQFVAVAADQYGNRLSGLAFTWSVQNGGTVDADGLFTAGDTSGTYRDTVKAEATWGGITQSGTASVTVEPERIAFISDQNDDQSDIYIMDIEGSNVERLTTTDAFEEVPSWSPDGRRIAYNLYDITGGIMVMNDDGGWTLRLIGNDSERAYLYPAWSPDGSKITFVKATPFETGVEDLDIFVMDVDGGNVTQLTDTSGGDEWLPTWSPDGTKIVYDFTLKDQAGDIYVINADGSNSQRLTSHPANDTEPDWSPDGTQIAFMSNRDGDYEIYVMNADGSNIRQLTSNSGIDDVTPAWSPDGTGILFVSDRDTPNKGEIYIMNVDGSNVTRLTDNSANNWSPAWAPRKMGIEVTEDSVIIPQASIRKEMTAQEITAQLSQSVVRIETDLVSGSGFIIDSNGLILTNNHVISDAEEITVYLEDGTSYSGTIEARDLVRDLAVIEIKAGGLPYLELGDLSQVGLGQQVVVLGYPLKAGSIAVTSGLVSAIEFDSGRNITWVQTDSAINPGNSGGPLLNLRGQVIGIVSAKLVGFGIEGVGFAVSANTVNTYLPRLEAGETIRAF